MKKTIATCIWASLTALLLSACGGTGDLGDRNDPLEGDTDGTEASAADDATADDATADDATGPTGGNEDDPGDQPVTGEIPGVDGPTDDGDDPGSTGNDTPTSDGDDPGSEDPGSDDPGSDDPGESDDTGSADPTSGGDDPAEPEPTDPAFEPCADKACGDECSTCPPGAQCLVGPGQCSASGECLLEEPVCEPTECPDFCPVPAICQLCDDESCADAVVECNPDGTCGDIEWVCKDEPEPEPTNCTEKCPVIEICQLCDDGSCATPIVACNADGSCGETTWECADIECKSDADCGQVAEPLCIDCSSETQGDAPQFAPPEDPLPETFECSTFQCVENVCKVKAPSCEYDPCEGKQDGDSCSLCEPNDPNCTETGVLKVCRESKCVNDTQSGQ